MADYKAIAERLNEQGLGAVDLAARTAANLPAILRALELAGAESKAASDVLAERARQKSVEGWTESHDDEHDRGELAEAAACYAHTAAREARGARRPYTAPLWWPWDIAGFKSKDARRDLVRAGALILAEIERLDRFSAINAALDAAEGEEVKRRFKVERARANGWTRWVQPVPRGYLMSCCDCGLVHRMEFRVVKGRVQFRAQRASRYTAQRRKQMAARRIAGSKGLK